MATSDVKVTLGSGANVATNSITEDAETKQLQIQASDDAGTTWYSVGAPLTAVASSTVSLTVNAVTAQLFRATVSTAGVGVTAGYTLLRAF